MKMIFLTLPVSDLQRARAFYEALGFRINEHSSDDQTAAVVVDESIVLRLLTRDRFAERVSGTAGDPADSTTAIACLTVDSRAEVDELVERAGTAGGRPGVPAREEGAAYVGSFSDPDGNAFEAMWMDQLHVVN